MPSLLPQRADEPAGLAQGVEKRHIVFQHEQALHPFGTRLAQGLEVAQKAAPGRVAGELVKCGRRNRVDKPNPVAVDGDALAAQFTADFAATVSPAGRVEDADSVEGLEIFGAHAGLLVGIQAGPQRCAAGQAVGRAGVCRF